MYRQVRVWVRLMCGTGGERAQRRASGLRKKASTRSGDYYGQAKPGRVKLFGFRPLQCNYNNIHVQAVIKCIIGLFIRGSVSIPLYIEYFTFLQRLANPNNYCISPFRYNIVSSSFNIALLGCYFKGQIYVPFRFITKNCLYSCIYSSYQVY